MNLTVAAFLGILQGFTEFLPVSSSGHLVIAQSLIPSFNQPGVLFDVVLHAGTLGAILLYFRKSILTIRVRFLALIIIGTVPAAILGFIFQTAIEKMFENIAIVGFALFVTAAMNNFTDKAKARYEKISKKFALLIGLAQAIAIIPGVSRAGSTIFTGASLGIERKKIFEFSFLLSVPAIIGANIFQFMTHAKGNELDLVFYATGFLAAFVSGYLAIGVLLKFLLSRQFKFFAYYTAALGVLAILLS